MEIDLIYLDRSFKEIVEYDEFKLNEDIKEFISNSGNRKFEFDNFYEWLLVVIYSFYKSRGFLQDKNVLYSSKEPVVAIYTTPEKDNKFHISAGMLYFASNFIDARLLNIPITLKSRIDEIEKELEESSDETKSKSLSLQLNKLETELSLRINRAQGLKSVLAFSKGNIKIFTKLILRNMNQFTLNVPTDNQTLDIEYKKAKNIITKSGENESVKRANQKALEYYNVEFHYFSQNEFEEPYFQMQITSRELIPKDPSYELALENASKVELKSFDPNNDSEDWRPTNSYILVAILKQILLGFGGQCTMADLKKIFAEIFSQAKKENPDFFEFQLPENQDIVEINRVNYRLNSNLFTEEAFKERRYYATKIKNYMNQYFGDLTPDNDLYLKKTEELERYINLIKEEVKSIKNNEKLDLLNIDKEKFNIKGVDKSLHDNFLSFINSLKNPKIINFTPLNILANMSVLNENYKLRIKI